MMAWGDAKLWRDAEAIEKAKEQMGWNGLSFADKMSRSQELAALAQSIKETL